MFSGFAVLALSACGPGTRMPMSSLQPKQINPTTDAPISKPSNSNSAPISGGGVFTGIGKGTNPGSVVNPAGGSSNAGGGSANSGGGSSIDFNAVFGEDQPETPQDKEAAKTETTDYVFGVPVSQPVQINYFYGPRVFSSMTKSMALEDHKVQPPVSVAASRSLVRWEFHPGIDFEAKLMTPVHAIAGGTVFISEALHSDCEGWVVVLKHDLPSGTLYSIYDHLSSPKSGKTLKVGTEVHQGDIIAYSGATGSKKCVQGAHLHLEVRVRTAAGSAPSGNEARWNYLYDQNASAKLNPADFIEKVDQMCQKRKIVEVDNAQLLEKWYPGRVPPITAGRCGRSFEKNYSTLPEIYYQTTNVAKH
jgi:murein DD-endopeptidase MepM/ murein hydrolase activator NlpD